MNKKHLIVNLVFLIVLGVSLPHLNPLIFAQTNQSSNQKQVIDQLLQLFISNGSDNTNSGNSTSGSGTGIDSLPTDPNVYPQSTQTIAQLVTDIKVNCGGSVNRQNESCLNKIGNLPSNVLNNLRPSTNNIKFPAANFLQCVRFVRAASLLFYGVDLNSSGDAINFSINVPTGFHFIPASPTAPMKEGDIPIWYGGSGSGHIAFVVKVYPNSIDFDVAESNSHLVGDVTINTTTKNSRLLKGWLTKL